MHIEEQLVEEQLPIRESFFILQFSFCTFQFSISSSSLRPINLP